MTLDYEALAKQIMAGASETIGNSNEVVRNLLKTEIGSVITGRFLLYAPNPKQSIYHFFSHGWKTSSGNFVSYLCPTTVNGKCPICQRSIAMWKSNSDFMKKESSKIRRRENWLVNFFVIDDNKNKENNGKVKAFKYSYQINEIVKEATEGADKAEFGTRIWRLDEHGCNFRLTAKANSDKKDAWPTYVSSKFLSPSPLDLGGRTVQELLDQAMDLTKIYDRMLDYDELQAELQSNFVDDLNKIGDGINSPVQKPPLNSAPQVVKEESEEDDLDYGNTKTVTKTAPPPPAAPEATGEAVGDNVIDDLLKDL